MRHGLAYISIFLILGNIFVVLMLLVIMGCVSLARKRIYNPKTGHYYRIATRSGSKHRKGQILGRWSPKKKKSKK